ncbi:MAG: methyltransferase [Marinobacterium sp.]|nr:methyltransferase [Marinobacterium sp.]
MTDPAFSLLRPALQRATGNCLWLADENLLQARLTPNPAITALCNRLDLHQALAKQGWQSQFCDFDFSGIADASQDHVIYRVSKEKPVVHHVINQAFRVLKPGGILELTGEKGEGIKSYIDKARKLFDGQCEAEKADKNYWYAELTRPEHQGPALDDSEYPLIRDAVKDEHFFFSSKPGLFGWNKIDKGSAFLIEQLPAMLDGLPHDRSEPLRSLDLGCGYGYLSLHLHRLLSSAVVSEALSSKTQPPETPPHKVLHHEIVATDNNAAAISCCQQNFQRYQLPGNVIAADCAKGITGVFELVICNPPFHTGFNVENSLTDRFLNATAQHLSHSGIACFVVNKHIPLERKATGYFSQVETCADNGHFKLVRMRYPHRG